MFIFTLYASAYLNLVCYFSPEWKMPLIKLLEKKLPQGRPGRFYVAKASNGHTKQETDKSRMFNYPHIMTKFKATFFRTLFASALVTACNINNHDASDHPCNFPDAQTENNLRSPWHYKIIDTSTSQNLVDTTAVAEIHPDSVILMDANFEPLPSAYYFNLDNWVFKNLVPYKDIPFNQPDALLKLEAKTFYLQTVKDDIDTIQITFNQCLVRSVLFNGLTTEKPANDPYLGSTTLYFKK